MIVAQTQVLHGEKEGQAQQRPGSKTLSNLAHRGSRRYVQEAVRSYDTKTNNILMKLHRRSNNPIYT